MYVPKQYVEDQPEAVWQLIRDYGFALFISQIENKPWAAHIPVEVGTDAEGQKMLHGHVAKANPQWRHLTDGDTVLVVFSGPHAYVSSSWYDHPNVPTWYYTAVHVYGKIKFLEGEAVVESLSLLTDRYESFSEAPVTVAGLPKRLMASHLVALKAFHIEITEIQAVKKLAQNRDEKNKQQIIEALKTRNHGFDAAIVKLLDGE